MLSAMGEQELTGVTLNSVHIREVLQLCSFLLNNYMIGLQLPPCNVDIHRRVGEHIAKYDTLLEIVKKKLRLFGHVAGLTHCRVGPRV